MPAIKSNPNLVTAFFHAASGQSAIEADKGILRGVKLMEVGHVATFKGEDGKPKTVTITPAHISALLGHAGNRALPIHHTHEWFDAQEAANADSVESNARMGSLKNFSRDNGGNLIADAFLNLDRQAARDLLFGAAHNPEDNCFSAVFSYRKDDPQCMPINFRAADVVPSGAATTALFTENTNTLPMDDDLISQLAEACKDPHKLAAFKALMKSVASASAIDTAADDASAATMESDAGVTDADKKPEDDQKPALMRAITRVNRAHARQTATLRADTLRDAEALLTKNLGKGGKFHIPTDDSVNGDEYTAKLAKYTETAKGNSVLGAFRLLKDHPELTPAHEAATRARMAKLSPQH